LYLGSEQAPAITQQYQWNTSKWNYPSAGKRKNPTLLLIINEQEVKNVNYFSLMGNFIF